MPKLSNPLYAEKVKKLSKIESERLLSRMSGKLPRRLEKDKLSREEALALQMELEDEQLQEWRKMMATLNSKAEKKEEKKEKKKEEKSEKQHSNEAEKAAPAAKVKAPSKVKSAEKPAKVVKAKKVTAK
ncbi:MAG: hypothetical protein PHP57_04475 [Sideroxydans sp.]|nr:hypothetical protein [Sideroxydans sp.]